MSQEFDPKVFGPPEAGNPKFDNDVQARVWGSKSAQAAKRITDAEKWGGFEAQGSLAEQIANPEPEIGWCVEGLIPARGSVLINAQWKVGKTALASVNLARSLVTGSPFLRRYKTTLEAHETVAIWNLEVDRQTLVDWLAKSSLADEETNRIHPQTLRGKRIDLTDETVADDTVRWLKERGVAVWIIDPLSKLYLGDENSNTEFNNWWAAMQDIAERAGVRVVVIVHHTAHSGTRARGASAMMGAPDVLVTYRHAGKEDEPPPDHRRWLRAFGRNVDIPEIELDFDTRTHELFVKDGGSTRTDARTETWAREAHAAIAKAGHALDTKALVAACKWPKSGTGYQQRVRAVERAAQWQWITRTTSEKKGNATLHDLGPVTPEPIQPASLRLVPMPAAAEGAQQP